MMQIAQYFLLKMVEPIKIFESMYKSPHTQIS